MIREAPRGQSFKAEPQKVELAGRGQEQPRNTLSLPKEWGGGNHTPDKELKVEYQRLKTHFTDVSISPRAVPR